MILSKHARGDWVGGPPVLLFLWQNILCQQAAGWTALHLSAAGGHQDVARILLKQRAEVNQEVHFHGKRVHHTDGIKMGQTWSNNPGKTMCHNGYPCGNNDASQQTRSLRGIGHFSKVSPSHIAVHKLLVSHGLVFHYGGIWRVISWWGISHGIFWQTEIGEKQHGMALTRNKRVIVHQEMNVRQGKEGKMTTSRTSKSPKKWRSTWRFEMWMPNALSRPCHCHLCHWHAYLGSWLWWNCWFAQRPS